VAFRVRPVRSLEEFRLAIGSIGHYFGWVPTEDDATRFSTVSPSRAANCPGLARSFDRRREILGGGGPYYGVPVGMQGTKY